MVLNHFKKIVSGIAGIGVAALLMLNFKQYFFVSENYLTDLITINTALLAFFIPLAVEISSRIFSQYNSSVISKIFFKESRIQYAVILLIAQIVIALFFRGIFGKAFAIQYPFDESDMLIFSLAVGLFLLELIILGVVVQISRLIRKYLLDTEDLIQAIFQNAKHDIQRKKAKFNYLEYLDAMAILLYSEIRRKKSKLALDALNLIYELFEEALKIGEKDISKFEILMLDPSASKDFLSDEQLPKQIELSPYDQLKGFSNFLSIFKRTFEIALETKSLKILDKSAGYIIKKICFFSSISAQEKIQSKLFYSNPFLKLALSNLINMLKNSFTTDYENFKDWQVRWYANIIFRSHIEFDKRAFDRIQNKFFELCKWLIIQEKTKNYFWFSEGLIYRIPSLDETSWISEITDEMLIKKLKNTKFSLFEFNDKKSLLNELSPHTEAKTIRDFIDLRFNYNALLNLMFFVCGYAFLKNNFSFLKSILHFKQPENSQSTSTNVDIIPETIEEACATYFNGKTFAFWEGQYDANTWRDRWFIIVLIYLLNFKEKKYSELNDFLAVQTIDTLEVIRDKTRRGTYNFLLINIAEHYITNEILEELDITNNEEKPFEKVKTFLIELHQLTELEIKNRTTPNPK